MDLYQVLFSTTNEDIMPQLYSAFFLIIVCYNGVVFGEPDPCFNFTPLNDSTRLSSYESDGTTERPSDRLLTPGWYRNMHPTEGDMMTVCPNATQCGTNFPVWINGTLPKKSETVTIKACKSLFGMCCASTLNIRVKGCNGYNVYELVPMPTSTGRYCFYGPGKCPRGQTSPTGFQPCSLSSISFTVNPRVTPRIPSHDFNSPERRLVFTCTGTPHSSYVFDIAWEVEGIEVKRVSNIAHADIPTIGSLAENEWNVTGYKIGMHVKCAIRARPHVNGLPTQFTKSRSFYAGFQVVTPNLSIKGGSQGYIRITSTVPVACAYNGGVKIPCDIRLEMFDFSEQVGDRATCQRNITKLVKRPARCGINFDGWRWNSQISFPVTTHVDQLYRTQYTAVVKLRALANDIDHLWDDYVIPDIKVVVTHPSTFRERSGKYCRSYNDPNLYTFDRSYMVISSVGEFIMYKHKTKPYAVHMLTQTDSRYKYVNCGVSVQAGADIFIIYGCDYPGKWIQKRFCTGDSQRLEVYEKNYGRQFEIHLPTGTRVNIDNRGHFLNVNIYISPSEWMKTEGLCGLFNGNRSDDIADRTGKIVSVAEYEKAWSVLPGESSFVEKTRTAKLERQYYFCSCVGNITSSSLQFSQRTDCSWQEGTQLCPSLTWDAKACDTRGKRNADGSYADDIIDAPLEIVNFRPSPTNVDTWKNGWNETWARSFCTEKIMGVSSMQSCRHLVDPSDSIDMCVSDIKISGDLKFLSGAVESFQSKCNNEVRLNTSLWVPAAPGQKSPAEEIEALQCPGECEHDGQRRGTCTNGVCHCFPHFDGPDCSIDLQSQPTLFPPSKTNICDKSKSYCGSMALYGLNFNANDLKCRLRVTEVENGQESSAGESIVNAVMETFNKIRCPLPDGVKRQKRSTSSVQQYTKILFSVSNNQQNYSNTIPVVLFDSRCIDCSLNGGQIDCIHKTNICVKNGICYPLSSKFCSDSHHGHDDDDDDDDHGSKLWIIGAVLGGVAIILVFAGIIIKLYHKSKTRVQAPYTEEKYEDLHIYNKPPASTHY